jgi:hypothetical protein
MERTNGRQHHRTCQTVNKETNILDQLKCCESFFQHIANNTGVAAVTSQFYDTVRVSMCYCNQVGT